jgi:hypothetical protein
MGWGHDAEGGGRCLHAAENASKIVYAGTRSGVVQRGKVSRLEEEHEQD